MNEKFTNGKWFVDTDTGSICVDGTGCVIGRAYGSSLISTEEFHANLQLLAHAKDLYYALEHARAFVPRDICIRTSIDSLMREINPDFDKRPEVTDIKKFAERVKNMREWQRVRECAKLPINNMELTDTERYVSGNEQLVDSIVAEILQEV